MLSRRTVGYEWGMRKPRPTGLTSHYTICRGKFGRPTKWNFRICSVLRRQLCSLYSIVNGNVKPITFHRNIERLIKRPIQRNTKLSFVMFFNDRNFKINEYKFFHENTRIAAFGFTFFIHTKISVEWKPEDRRSYRTFELQYPDNQRYIELVHDL